MVGHVKCLSVFVKIQRLSWFSVWRKNPDSGPIQGQNYTNIHILCVRMFWMESSFTLWIICVGMHIVPATVKQFRKWEEWNRKVNQIVASLKYNCIGKDCWQARNCNDKFVEWILIQCVFILWRPHLSWILPPTSSKYAFLNFQVCACGFVGSKKLPHLLREKNRFAFLPKDLLAFGNCIRSRCTLFLLISAPILLCSLLLSHFSSFVPIPFVSLRFHAYSHTAQ